MLCDYAQIVVVLLATLMAVAFIIFLDVLYSLDPRIRAGDVVMLIGSTSFMTAGLVVIGVLFLAYGPIIRPAVPPPTREEQCTGDTHPSIPTYGESHEESPASTPACIHAELRRPASEARSGVARPRGVPPSPISAPSSGLSKWCPIPVNTPPPVPTAPAASSRAVLEDRR